MTRTLIKNGFVVSMDPKIGDLPRADLLVENDRITEIGPDLDVTDAQLIDADGCIVMPGLIDTHRHIWQGALRAVCADWSLIDYVRGIRMNAALWISRSALPTISLLASPSTCCRNIHLNGTAAAEYALNENGVGEKCPWLAELLS